MATLETNSNHGVENCTELKSLDINNHFKDLLLQTSKTVKKTIKGLNHLGIYINDPCKKNKECVCNILSDGVSKFKNIRHPWYEIYPEKLPSKGANPFVPPLGWEKLQAPKRGPGNQKNGYVDINGDVWMRDKLHKDHWDVQRGRNGEYSNINDDGTCLD